MRTVKLNWKATALSALAAVAMSCPLQTSAAVKDVMCVKTNTGEYYPVVRVSMMVVPDGGSTFEIVLKDGVGSTGVESISFEKHQEDVDFSKYTLDSNGNAPIDFTKKIYLMTSTGKYFTFATLPSLQAQEGTGLIDVVSGSTTEANVASVYFYRGDDPEGAAGLTTPYAEERLQLLTPISQQLTISGCGEASVAVLYGLDGRMIGKAPVVEGVSSIQVGHLMAGTYIVKVGNKSLSFNKR